MIAIITSDDFRELAPEAFRCGNCGRDLERVDGSSAEPEGGAIERREIWECEYCGTEKQLTQLEATAA